MFHSQRSSSGMNAFKPRKKRHIPDARGTRITRNWHKKCRSRLAPDREADGRKDSSSHMVLSVPITTSCTAHKSNRKPSCRAQTMKKSSSKPMLQSPLSCFPAIRLSPTLMLSTWLYLSQHFAIFGWPSLGVLPALPIPNFRLTHLRRPSLPVVSRIRMSRAKMASLECACRTNSKPLGVSTRSLRTRLRAHLYRRTCAPISLQ